MGRGTVRLERPAAEVSENGIRFVWQAGRCGCEGQSAMGRGRFWAADERRWTPIEVSGNGIRFVWYGRRESGG